MSQKDWKKISRDGKRITIDMKVVTDQIIDNLVEVTIVARRGEERIAPHSKEALADRQRAKRAETARAKGPAVHNGEGEKGEGAGEENKSSGGSVTEKAPPSGEGDKGSEIGGETKSIDP
jgi:hypothetical protein